MGTVRVVEETTTGERAPSWELELAEERPTLRELIRRRAFQEVAEHNAAAAPGAERPDPERRFAAAVTAFSRNGFVVLVGERQVEELDEAVELPFGAEVVFLKLVPLVGG